METVFNAVDAVVNNNSVLFKELLKSTFLFLPGAHIDTWLFSLGLWWAILSILAAVAAAVYSCWTVLESIGIESRWN